MELFDKWQNSDFEFIIVVLCVTICFNFYHFITTAANTKEKFIQHYSQSHLIFFQRFTGVCFYGLVPVVVVLVFLTKDLEDYGLNFSFQMVMLHWILILGGILLLTVLLTAQKPENLKQYPQIRQKQWSLQLLIFSALSWVVYLLAYEFTFRGFLLFASVRAIGVWPAIGLNAAIYSLVHVPKGAREAAGSIPLGIVLSFATLQTGNIIIPFTVHCILALSNEWSAVYHHPDIKLNFKRFK